MNHNERISISHACGVLRVIQAILQDMDSKRAAEILGDQEETLWAMADPLCVDATTKKGRPDE